MNMNLVQLFRAAFAAFLVAAALAAAPVQAFEQQSTWAGTAQGTVNAPFINLNNVQSLSDLTGVIIHFVPSGPNTGPVTVTVGAMAATPLVRPTSVGPQPLAGKELLDQEPASIMYGGSAFILMSNVDMTAIGASVTFRGTAAPRGTLLEDGSCVSRSTFSTLFVVVGTTYNVCDGVSTFGVPNTAGGHNAIKY